MSPIEKLQRLQVYLLRLERETELPYGPLFGSIAGDLNAIELDIQRITAGCDEDMPKSSGSEEKTLI